MCETANIRRFDPDAFHEVVSGGQFDHYLLDPGPVSATLTRWQCAGVYIDRGVYDFPVFVEGAFKPGYICIGFVDGPVKTVINAVPAGPCDIQIYPEGVDINFHAESRTTWIVVQVCRDLLQRTAVAHGGYPLHLSDHQMVNMSASPQAIRRVHNVVASVFGDFENGVLPHEAPETSADMVVMALIDALRTCENPNDRDAEYRKHVAGMAVVDAARTWMREQYASNYDSAAVCTAVGVPERTLQLYFRRITGMSPREWHMRMRLYRAYRMLSSNDGLSVTDVALRCGFLHLGRFSTIYKRLFRVLPSETVRTESQVATPSLH